jgi:hypothetical protein
VRFCPLPAVRALPLRSLGAESSAPLAHTEINASTLARSRDCLRPLASVGRRIVLHRHTEVSANTTRAEARVCICFCLFALTSGAGTHLFLQRRSAPPARSGELSLHAGTYAGGALRAGRASARPRTHCARPTAGVDPTPYGGPGGGAGARGYGPAVAQGYGPTVAPGYCCTPASGAGPAACA